MHFTGKDSHRLKVKGWKLIYHENGSRKQAEVATDISNKADVKLKLIRRDKERHFILVKGKIQQEGTTIIFMF